MWHETWPPSTKAATAADNQNPSNAGRGQLMARSQWAHEDSHLLPARPRITCIWQDCLYTAGDMQLRSVLLQDTGMLIDSNGMEEEKALS